MLTLMTVTKQEDFAKPFLADMYNLAQSLGAQLLIGFDGSPDEHVNEAGHVTVVPVQSQGYLESVHDYVLMHAKGDYVLRLDDDERASEAMKVWLAQREYEKADHWRFPRAHLWRDEGTFLLSQHLWPDYQTRLSVKAKAGGRNVIHAGSPFGGGTTAPVAIEHHKFLVKSVAERREIQLRYDQIQPGAGSGMMPFNLPEVAYAGDPAVQLVELGDGGFEDGQVPYGWGERAFV